MIIAVYTLGLRMYGWLIQLFSLWNPKAQALAAGWRADLTKTRKDIVHEEAGVVTKEFELVWIHCASLGEFEMAKPIAAALQAASSQRHVLFSFFSPSGYKYAVLNHNQTKVYLPLDGRGSAARFHAQWQPQAAIIIRYEFWYHHLNTALKANIPTFALGVSLRPNHFLLSKLASPWQRILKQLNGIGLINESMLLLAKQNNFHNAFLFGDTKFNRAYERAQQTPTPHPKLQAWMQQKPTLILGSAWMPEITLLKEFILSHPQALQHWQILIAPHNISAEFCTQILTELQLISPVKFTEQAQENMDSAVVILDTIGQLAECYRYGSLAIIGGAFGKGLHNTIEAVAFGLPVIFGPNHQKFPEAQQFINAGFGFCVGDNASFNDILLRLTSEIQANESNPSQRTHPLSAIAKNFVESHRADVQQFVNLTYPYAIKHA